MSLYEVKFIGGHVTGHESKVIERDGVRLGEIEGYIATWDIDQGLDRFKRGAFKESLTEHRKRNNRQVRMLSQHRTLIGGWPIAGVREDEKGLFGKGEINLDTVEGSNVYALARQGVLVDLSVGFSARDYAWNDEEFTFENESEPRSVRVRTIKKATLWEGSPVDEPMNRAAQITAVKSWSDLPIARGAKWVGDAGDVDPRAFLDPSDQTTGFAQTIDGVLCAVPERLAALAKERGADLPDEQKRHIERYFAKMGEPSPFDSDARTFFGAADVEKWTKRELEAALLRSGAFSKSAATAVASRYAGAQLQDQEERAILEALGGLKTIRIA